jgi:hypothetical protein
MLFPIAGPTPDSPGLLPRKRTQMSEELTGKIKELKTRLVELGRYL